MNRTRKAFVVYVDLDPIPGTFHTQESAQNVIGRILKEAIPHYNPMISLAPAHLQPEQTAEVLRVPKHVEASLREYVERTPIFKLEVEEVPELLPFQKVDLDQMTLEAGTENES